MHFLNNNIIYINDIISDNQGFDYDVWKRYYHFLSCKVKTELYREGAKYGQGNIKKIVPLNSNSPQLLL